MTVTSTCSCALSRRSRARSIPSRVRSNGRRASDWIKCSNASASSPRFAVQSTTRSETGRGGPTCWRGSPHPGGWSCEAPHAVPRWCRAHAGARLGRACRASVWRAARCAGPPPAPTVQETRGVAGQREGHPGVGRTTGDGGSGCPPLEEPLLKQGAFVRRKIGDPPLKITHHPAPPTLQSRPASAPDRRAPSCRQAAP